AAVTRRPLAVSSTRSSLRVSATSAWSPRSATSASIARTAASTSAAVSRLVARKARKRSAKSGARVSRRIGMAKSARRAGGARGSGQWPGRRGGGTPRRGGAPRLGGGVGGGAVVDGEGLCGGTPARPQVGEFALQAFDLEPQLRAAGEGERHDTSGRVGLLEFDRQQVENRVFTARIHVFAFAGAHPLETQGRGAAAQLRLVADGGRPIETVDRQYEALLLRPPEHVRDPDRGVLQMG